MRRLQLRTVRWEPAPGSRTRCERGLRTRWGSAYSIGPTETGLKPCTRFCPCGVSVVASFPSCRGLTVPALSLSPARFAVVRRRALWRDSHLKDNLGADGRTRRSDRWVSPYEGREPALPFPAAFAPVQVRPDSDSRRGEVQFARDRLYGPCSRHAGAFTASALYLTRYRPVPTGSPLCAAPISPNSVKFRARSSARISSP